MEFGIKKQVHTNKPTVYTCTSQLYQTVGRAWLAHMFMVLVEEVSQHGDVLCDIDR